MSNFNGLANVYDYDKLLFYCRINANAAGNPYKANLELIGQGLHEGSAAENKNGFRLEMSTPNMKGLTLGAMTGVKCEESKVLANANFEFKFEESKHYRVEAEVEAEKLEGFFSYDVNGKFKFTPGDDTPSELEANIKHIYNEEELEMEANVS